jgi:hypothetical protein
MPRTRGSTTSQIGHRVHEAEGTRTKFGLLINLKTDLIVPQDAARHRRPGDRMKPRDV